MKEVSCTELWKRVEVWKYCHSLSHSSGLSAHVVVVQVNGNSGHRWVASINEWCWVRRSAQTALVALASLSTLPDNELSFYFFSKCCWGFEVMLWQTFVWAAATSVVRFWTIIVFPQHKCACVGNWKGFPWYLQRLSSGSWDCVLLNCAINVCDDVCVWFRNGNYRCHGYKGRNSLERANSLQLFVLKLLCVPSEWICCQVFLERFLVG